MRADLIIAIVLAALCAFFTVAGFFLWDWSLILVGLFAAVFVAADGYFLYGVFQMAKESQTKKAP